MPPRSVLTLVAVGFAVLLGACKENPVGRLCFIGAGSGSGSTVVGSPALDCESRTCLRVADAPSDLCTAECSSDEDCDAVTESPCMGGFVCVIPVVTGNFCCKKLCACVDYLPDEMAFPEPAACDASNANNECCNLPGRAACTN